MFPELVITQRSLLSEWLHFFEKLAFFEREWLALFLALWTKGSKKPEKSKNRCLLRFMGQEPQDERQQKDQEIQKPMPFKNCRTSAFAPKAAKKPKVRCTPNGGVIGTGFILAD